MQHDVLVQPRDPVRFIEREVASTYSNLGSSSPAGLPGALYHYTSGYGLLGILSSGEIHCTNLLYMNDASEMDYGRTLARGIIGDVLETVSEGVRPHLGRIAVNLSQPDFQYFISCFCEKPDLLSQWRAYGAQAAGYSIGFSADDLQTVLGDYSELVQVIYDPEVQSRKVSDVLRRYIQTAERCCAEYARHQRLEDALTRWVAAASNGLSRLIARLKSEAFSEEHEWRVMITRFSFDTTDVRFRVAANGIVVPYIAWRFRKEGVKAVRQVRHGPTINPQLAVQSVGVLLHNLGYRDVSVSGSKIPLRA